MQSPIPHWIIGSIDVSIVPYETKNSPSKLEGARGRVSNPTIPFEESYSPV